MLKLAVHWRSHDRCLVGNPIGRLSGFKGCNGLEYGFSGVRDIWATGLWPDLLGACNDLDKILARPPQRDFLSGGVLIGSGFAGIGS
jgi:hypothetical protein